MSTSIIGDKVIVLWQVLLVILICALVVALGPWLIGIIQRRRTQLVSSFPSRVTACLAGALVGALGVPVVAFILFRLIETMWATPGSWGASVSITVLVISLVGSALLVVAVTRGLLRPPSPLGGAIWLVGLLMASSGWTVDWCALRTLKRERTLSKRPVDASNLRGIKASLDLYVQDFQDYPQDLRQLVDARLASPKQLISVAVAMQHGTRIAIPDITDAPYDGPCHFGYFVLPADAPKHLAWLWQDPICHGNEGGYIVDKAGEVQWLKPDELERRLTETRAWLKNQAPAVSSRPAG